MLRVLLLIILFLNVSSAANKVFFSVDNTSYIWKEIQVKQLQNEFAKHQHIKFSYASASGNIANQVHDIEDAIEKGVDVLIVSPVNAQVITEVIEKAYDKGIKVIFAIRAANTKKYHTYIHPDDNQIAQRAAKYILQTTKDPKVVMIQGRLGANTVKNRREGFVKIFNKHAHAKIVAMEVGNYKPDVALSIMDKLINEKVQFNAVYTHNDAMQEGVRIALKTNGYDLSKITLVGIDYIKEAQEAIEKGEMDATFTYPTSYEQIVKSTLLLLQDKTVDKDIVVPSTLITKDNIKKIEPLF